MFLAKNGLRHHRRNHGSGWREPDPRRLSGKHHRQHDPILPSTVPAVRDHHRIRLPRSGALSDSRRIRIGSFYRKIRELCGGVWCSTSTERTRRKVRLVQKNSWAAAPSSSHLFSRPCPCLTISSLFLSESSSIVQSRRSSRSTQESLS